MTVAKVNESSISVDPSHFFDGFDAASQKAKLLGSLESSFLIFTFSRSFIYRTRGKISKDYDGVDVAP